MSIEIPLIIALLISLGANLLGFFYLRDLLGRFLWLSQNLANLGDLLQGYQKHLKNIYELEQFYGDQQIKALVEHSADLVEVLQEYIEAGLDIELLEDEEEVSELSNEDNNNDEEKKEE
tara:strand:+ start:686 stop:1042 length:357 start_codon:yes stop_codon:yes gene_type:complete